jgi:4'-phosphopantetheinyl transferase
MVDVWVVRLTRARRHLQEADRRLLDVLRTYVDAPEDAMRRRRGGKPYLEGSEVRFNLTHSRDLALVAVAHGRELGVDIEYRKPGRPIDGLARRVMTPAEHAEFERIPTDAREASFYRYWTAKEAFGKAIGWGMRAIPHFDVALDPLRLVATRLDHTRAEDWWLTTIEVDPAYAAALALEGGPAEVRVYAWGSSDGGGVGVRSGLHIPQADQPRA